MAHAWWSGVALLAVGAAGCGGSLSGGMGGAGGGGNGGAGTGGSSGSGGSTGTTGRAGTSGDSYDAGLGGSPYDGTYHWGAVAIHVGPATTVPIDLRLQVSDPAAPGTIISTANFAAATRFVPNDGAYVMGHIGCGAGTVYQLDIYTCANETITAGTRTPGCLGVTFIASGITGNFMSTDGVRCDVQGGSAAFDLPSPTFVAPPDAGPPSPAATGMFLLDCAQSDGTHRRLEAQFAIPIEWRFLLC